MLWLNPKWQTDYKFGAFSLLCLNLNGTTHHIHNILGNSHAKSGTLGSADCGSPLPLKRRKYILYKFLTHADSIILYPDLVQRTASYIPWILLQPDRNGSSRRCKLNRIGQKIQKYLVQPHLITIDFFISHVHGIHIKIQLLRMDLPTDNGLQVMEYLRQTDLRFFHMELSTLNPAHIQYVIDQ